MVKDHTLTFLDPSLNWHFPFSGDSQLLPGGYGDPLVVLGELGSHRVVVADSLEDCLAGRPLLVAEHLGGDGGPLVVVGKLGSHLVD